MTMVDSKISKVAKRKAVESNATNKSLQFKKVRAIVPDIEPENVKKIEHVEETYAEEEQESPTTTANKNSYDAHFGEDIQGLQDAISQVQARKYTTLNSEHPILQHISTSTVLPVTDTSTWTTLSDFSVKQRLHQPWLKLNSSAMTETQQAMYRQYCHYGDFMFTDANHKNRVEYRNLYCLHALNHICITRDRILKNNARADTQTDLRDQGFTRPKILILVPFRNSAYKIIHTLISLVGESQKENMKRFVDEYGPSKDVPERKASKPDDFIATFEGNVDDCFRIGIKLNRKSVKLFAPMYGSDVIVASPLGMRLPYGDDQDDAIDFLSSIEITIMDETDVFLMQNWDHVVNVFENLNKLPKKAHDCDFSRVKQWYLDDKAKYLRQTLCFTSFVTPEINSLFNSLTNIGGRCRTRTVSHGITNQVVLQTPQVFLRIPSSSISEVDDARFNYFVTNILPSIHRNTHPQTLIMIPSYFDFVRLRNHLSSVSVEFAGLSEYTSKSKVSRDRALFFQGRLKVMLYTERIHYFHRYNLKGIQNIVFYSLPDHAEHYVELLNMMEKKGGTVSILFSKYDVLKLERIVGGAVTQNILHNPVDKYLLET
ncbi:hypothetical protein SmJEL517_g04865 [Synchytrium microbalum]|uniref:U3 small nucleolar RNA-associated protein 25 n=1 Tax=Synchytrium microbalum TaxID=1806994 RepID=A0A507C1J7_9FUNG|nr:uncharacterized protein SmJEL517_g04865 [Synchytrium microbalum]TPX31944.1 hypothetical protein SmJEL517_g04865 [Synchytrium microbalum]